MNHTPEGSWEQNYENTLDATFTKLKKAISAYETFAKTTLPAAVTDLIGFEKWDMVKKKQIATRLNNNSTPFRT